MRSCPARTARGSSTRSAAASTASRSATASGSSSPSTTAPERHRRRVHRRPGRPRRPPPRHRVVRRGRQPRRTRDDRPPCSHRARGRPRPAGPGALDGPCRAGDRRRRRGRACRDPARALGGSDRGHHREQRREGARSRRPLAPTTSSTTPAATPQPGSATSPRTALTWWSTSRSSRTSTWSAGCSSPRGSVSAYANTGGTEADLPVRPLHGAQRAAPVRAALHRRRGRPPRRGRGCHRGTADGALEVGEEHGLPLTRFPLEETAAAHDAVERGPSARC